MPDLANLAYVQRVNRAIDHVHQHLDGDLSLTNLARIACFSPYHFHRVFRGVTGETPHAFIRRVRLERVLYLRAHHRDRTLTEIALACGFASSSDFSRTFRKVYGVSPRGFDLEAHRARNRASMPVTPADDGLRVQVRSLPARTVAYLRVRQPFEPGNVQAGAERLMAWADARGLGDGPWLGYMWDEPETVGLDRCRYDVGVEIPRRIRTEGEVGLLELPPMQVAEVEVSGSLLLEQRAWDWLYGTWLPTSGFEPDHQPAFEAWRGRPYAHGDTHFELAIQLPVVRASLPL